MDPPSRTVAYAHDCQRFDGLYVGLLLSRTAIESPSLRVPVYRCIDPSLRDQYPTLGTEVTGYRVPPGGDLERGVNRLLPVFARKLRSISADLVHVWSVSLAGLIRYRSDVVVSVPDLAKFTTRYYGAIPSYLHNRMLPYLGRARGVVCLTEWTRSEIVNLLRLPADRVHVAPPTSSIPPPRYTLPRVAAPPTDSSPWTLLDVAVDRPHKNLEFFLRILARLDRRFRARIVTRPTARTSALAARLGVSDRIEFLSDVPDMAPVYRTADVLVFPSLYEGFGLPLLEAMSQGVPVIAANRTCIPEVVAGGGAILDPTDPGPWADAVRRLVDPEAYRDASQRASARAGEFTPERLRDALLRAYAPEAQ